ncbi:polysaccharide biosynthesis protein [Methanolobus psychrophilus R15]|nr:polysaccharide biosynthesis protein [Methanolobus psychrophilus R15]
MSTILKIARNSGYLLFGRVATKIISFLILLYIARYLGPEEFGTFSFAFAFIYFFGFIPDMGVHNVLVREISKKPEDASILIGNATILKVILSFVAFVLSLSTIYFLDYPSHIESTLYIASLGLLITSVSAYGVIYETKLKMEYSVFFSIASRIFFLIAVYAGIYYNQSLGYFVLASIVSDLIHNLLMYLFSKRFVVPSFKLNTALLKNIMLEALPIAVASVFTMIYFRIDVVMLQFMKSNIAVGYYSAAYRLTEALVFVPSVFMTSVFPLMSQYYKSSHTNFTQSYIRSFKYLLASGLFLAVLATTFAEWIISFMYGTEYNNSVTVLRILIWATAVMFINILLSFTYISSNNQKMIAKISAFAAFLNVIMNASLIPHYSYNGAAIATLLTEMIVMVFGIYWIYKNVINVPLTRELSYPLFGAFSVSVFLFGLGQYNMLVLCPFSVPLYVGILYYTGWIDSYDIKAFNKIFRLKKIV